MGCRLNTGEVPIIDECWSELECCDPSIEEWAFFGTLASRPTAELREIVQ